VQAGNLIVKLSFKSPGTGGLGAKNAAHLRYIGTRPGVDTTVTDAALYRAAGSELGSDEAYARYIAERPGVAREDAEGTALHGLFDAQGPADYAAVRAELRGLEHSPAYRMILSVTEETADAAGLWEKRDWETFVCAQTPTLAHGLGIRLDDLRWVAALHPEAGHPHVHLIAWDAQDQRRPRDVIAKDDLVRMREELTRELWRPVTLELGAEKSGIRQEVVDSAKAELDRLGVLMGWTPAGAPARAVTTPVRTAEELARIEGGVERVAALLPGRGRLAYGYMPPETKAVIDAVTRDLLGHAEYRTLTDRYADLAAELASHQTTAPARIEAAGAAARGDLEHRVGQRVLEAAAGLEQARLRERVWRAVPVLVSRGARSGLPPAMYEQAARACGAAGVPDVRVYAALAAAHGDGGAISDTREIGIESGRIRPADAAALERMAGEDRPMPVTGGLSAAAHLAARAYQDLARAQERPSRAPTAHQRGRRRSQEHSIWRDAEPDTGRDDR